MASGEAHDWVHARLSGWPQARQGLATELIERYGLPQEQTARELRWLERPPWKRIVLHRDGVPHNFPLRHEDVLGQTVSYRVPREKLAELAAYDGSLVIDHTRGELTAHCDAELTNTIVLNLADEIIRGERTSDEALAYHAQLVRAMQTHTPESYGSKLRFTPVPTAQAGDPGMEAELLRHLGE